MKPLRLCLLGCGNVARLHSRIARTLRSDIRLSYASRSKDKAQEYNRKFGGVGAFGSYEEACASPDVDAVFIVTPHAYHLEHTRLAAQHHKHVLIEKPVTRDLAELTQVETAVRDAGVLAMVAENYYFKPLIRVIRHYIERGDLGEVMFLELNRANRSNTSGWRADAELMGGGALLEGGVHWVNLMCRLGGEVDEVLAAQPRKPVPPTAPFEDSLEVLFKFSDGSIGKLLHSWNLVNRTAGLQMSKLYGSAGNIHFESNGLFALVAGRRWRFRIPGLLDIMGYRAMLRHFSECVRQGREPDMSLGVARRDMELVDAAYRSLESGRFERPANERS